MVPAPWARDAALRYQPTDDIGVHLTLNCEYEAYRCGPITHAPSLLSGEGGFPRHIDDLWEHADPDEVLRECRAQIERALAWGIDVTHLTPHLTAITLRPEFFDVYLELAVEFRLPDPPAVDDHRRAGRLPVPQPRRRRRASCSPTTSTTTGAPAAASGSTTRSATLQPGVTEIHVQPAIDTPEVRALTDAARRLDRRLRAGHQRSDSSPKLLAASGAMLIGYRQLRDAMRAG